MGSIMQGKPVGFALEQFKSYYATQLTELSTLLRDAQFGLRIEPSIVADRWTAAEDAGGLLILGDPAARLPLAHVDEEQRPTITQ